MIQWIIVHLKYRHYIHSINVLEYLTTWTNDFLLLNENSVLNFCINVCMFFHGKYDTEM